MKFKSYTCVFIGKINAIYILITEKSIREIPGFFKISRDTPRSKIKPGSRELNPTTQESRCVTKELGTHVFIFTLQS